MKPNILNEIIASKLESLKSRKQELPLERIMPSVLANKKVSVFKDALSKKNSTNIIAEIKRASPSLGLIRKDYLPAKIAKEYEDGGASAISVLTEEKYFRGCIEHIAEVKKSSVLPVLRKDFVIDNYQLYESRHYGADAVLLIAAALESRQISEFLGLARSIGLECLVEVHSEEDLKKLDGIDCDIIGINARNLNDFSVNTREAAKMLSMIPQGIVKVMESGIKSRAQIIEFQKMGADAFLIGETLMRSGDISSTLIGLLNDQN